jgi:hypothetical protein
MRLGCSFLNDDFGWLSKFCFKSPPGPETGQGRCERGWSNFLKLLRGRKVNALPIEVVMETHRMQQSKFGGSESCSQLNNVSIYLKLFLLCVFLNISE